MVLESKLFVGNLAVDDRGSVRFVNDFNFEGVKRFYQVENHRRGFIRAWHGHVKEGKYVYVTSGTALVSCVKLDYNDITCSYVKHTPNKYVLSAMKPTVLWIPPGHFNGFMNLEDNTKLMFFSTSTLDESKGDDIRMPYNHWDVWSEDFR